MGWPSVAVCLTVQILVFTSSLRVDDEEISPGSLAAPDLEDTARDDEQISHSSSAVPDLEVSSDSLLEAAGCDEHEEAVKKANCLCTVANGEDAEARYEAFAAACWKQAETVRAAVEGWTCDIRQLSADQPRQCGPVMWVDPNKATAGKEAAGDSSGDLAVVRRVPEATAELVERPDESLTVGKDRIPESPESSSRGPRLREMFDSIDADHDGSFSQLHLIKALRDVKDGEELATSLGLPSKIGQETGTMWKVTEKFQAMDADGDKKVTWQEFSSRATLEGEEDRLPIEDRGQILAIEDRKTGGQLAIEDSDPEASACECGKEGMCSHVDPADNPEGCKVCKESCNYQQEFERKKAAAKPPKLKPHTDDCAHEAKFMVAARVQIKESTRDLNGKIGKVESSDCTRKDAASPSIRTYTLRLEDSTEETVEEEKLETVKPAAVLHPGDLPADQGRSTESGDEDLKEEELTAMINGLPQPPKEDDEDPFAGQDDEDPFAGQDDLSDPSKQHGNATLDDAGSNEHKDTSYDMFEDEAMTSTDAFNGIPSDAVLLGTVRECSPEKAESKCSNASSLSNRTAKDAQECTRTCRHIDNCTGGYFDSVKKMCYFFSQPCQEAWDKTSTSFTCEKDNYRLFWTQAGQEYMRSEKGMEVVFNSGVTKDQLKSIYETGNSWMMARNKKYVVEAVDEQIGCWQSKDGREKVTQEVSGSIVMRNKECPMKNYTSDGYTCGKWWCSYKGRSQDKKGNTQLCADYFPDKVFHPKAQKCVDREILQKVLPFNGEDKFWPHEKTLEKCYTTCHSKNCDGKGLLVVKNQTSGCCFGWSGVCDFCCHDK